MYSLLPAMYYHNTVQVLKQAKTHSVQPKLMCIDNLHMIRHPSEDGQCTAIHLPTIQPADGDILLHAEQVPRLEVKYRGLG